MDSPYPDPRIVRITTDRFDEKTLVCSFGHGAVIAFELTGVTLRAGGSGAELTRGFDHLALLVGARSRALTASLRATGSRECAPDDRLREAIHLAMQWKNGLLRRLAPRNDGAFAPRKLNREAIAAVVE